MIRFLAEISERFKGEIHLTPSNDIPRNNNIYEMDISPHPEESYWIDWGGFYDNFTGTQIELYFRQFLTRARTFGDLLIILYSIYLTDELRALGNLSKHPWLYADNEVEASHSLQFLSSALDTLNPSNNILREMRTPVKLDIPSLTVKLSDNISGITLNQGFSISLHNNDGYFDDEVRWNLFNTPVYLKKTTVENPEYTDFKPIRNGLAENTSTTFNNFLINIAEKFRAMDDPVCDVVLAENFHGITVNESSLNKNIPIVYGQKKINILELAEGVYLSAEGARAVQNVQTRDGIELPIKPFNANTGLIEFNYAVVASVRGRENALLAHTVRSNYIQVVQVGDSFPVVDSIADIRGNTFPFRYDRSTGIIVFPRAETAVITGYADNRIGDIIEDLVERKAGIQFTETNWNIDETNAYAEKSAKINLVIERGTVKNAIHNVLKNDMAFFIQQMDGRLTIRKYGETYATYTIPAWPITQRPEKTWGSAQENYFSSCIINYDFIDDDLFSSLLFINREGEAERIYRRRVRKTFDTDLVNKDYALELAKLLASRYLIMKQTIRLPVGIDTSGFELLDTIVIGIDINERKFSKAFKFMIKEIDPAQDILVLEEIE